MGCSGHRTNGRTSAHATACPTTRGHAGRGRASCSRVRPREAGAHVTTAAELVTRVTLLIPTPDAALCTDDPSWSGFVDLLAEAADLLARTLGADGIAPLRLLAGSPSMDESPVRTMLIEQTLDRLTLLGS